MSQAEDDATHVDATSKWDEFLVEGQAIIDGVVGGELLPARTARKIIAFRAEFQDPDLGIFVRSSGTTNTSASINFQKDYQAVKPNVVTGGPARQRKAKLIFAKSRELASRYFPPKPSESESAAWPQVRDDIAKSLGRALTI